MTSRRRLPFLPALLLAVVLQVLSASCYTLNGVSVSPETRSFYIGQFDVTSAEAPATSGQQFSERLKAKINTNTRLAFSESDPDVEFVGSITGWVVTPEAPNAQQGADLNRLTVNVQSDYTDHRTEANSYSQTFTDFESFPGNQDLLAVQDRLSDILLERLSEEAFNKAFSNW